MAAARSIPKWARGDPVAPERLRLLGGRLCLDFANTIEARLSHQPVEFLRDAADVVRWGRHVGLDVAGDGISAGAFERALALRDATHRVFLAAAHHEAPAAADLERLRTEHVAALGLAHLVREGDAFGWIWPSDVDAVDRVLAAVTCSAIDLLTEGDLRRIRECPGAGDCGWLFYDASKNASRRWCSMDGCGSRVKMRRHYARTRDGSSPTNGRGTTAARR